MNALSKVMTAATIVIGVASSALAQDSEPQVRITFDEEFKTGMREQGFSVEAQGRFNFISVDCEANDNDGEYVANLEYFPSEKEVLNSDDYPAVKYREIKDDMPHLAEHWREMQLRDVTTYESYMNRMARQETWEAIPKGEVKHMFDGAVSTDGTIRILNGNSDVINFWATEDFDPSGQEVSEEALAKVTNYVRVQCGFGL